MQFRTTVLILVHSLKQKKRVNAVLYLSQINSLKKYKTYSSFISRHKKSLNKWVSSIFSRRSLLFSTLFFLKIPLFELNNPFAFHRNWSVDIQSMLVFLQLTHDFLPSCKTAKPSVYIFGLGLFRLRKCLCRDRALCFSPSAEDRRAGSIIFHSWLVWPLIQANKSDCMFIKLSTNWNFA